MPRHQDIDMVGKVRGKLTVISQADNKIKPNGNAVRMWNCVCECGKKCVYETARLNQTKYVSCGCEMRRKFAYMNKRALG